MKTCRICKVERDLEEFSKDSRSKDEKQGRCKACDNDISKIYRDTHPEYFKEKGREQYQKNKHLNKERYAKNIDRFKFFRKRYTSTVVGRFNTLICSAKSRSVKKGNQFDLDLEWLLGIYDMQNGKCILTGTKLEFGHNDDNSRRYMPNSPSLDKIDPKSGYTKDNTRLVCTHVNIAMNEFGEETFEQLALDFLAKRGFLISKA